MVARVAIICATLVVLFLIAVVFGWLLARRQERMRAREKGQALYGDLNRNEEQALVALLASAALILRDLGQNTEENYGDPEILRADTKIDVGRWLQVYDAKTKTKEKVAK
jgi:hypothetical protein